MPMRSVISSRSFMKTATASHGKFDDPNGVRWSFRRQNLSANWRLSARMYAGGEGNDVVLTAVNAQPTFTTGSDQTATDENSAQSIPQLGAEHFGGPVR